MSNNSSKTIKLSDLAKIQVGQSFRKAVLEDPTSDHFIIQTRDLLPGGTISKNLMRLSKINEKPKANAKVGDIIILSRGVRFTAGVIKEIQGPTTIQSMFHIIKLNKESGIQPEYLASFLNTDAAQNFLESLSIGATVQHLKIDDLGSLRIPVPPLNVQQGFCALADTVHQELLLLEKLKNLRKQQLNATLSKL